MSRPRELPRLNIDEHREKPKCAPPADVLYCGGESLSHEAIPKRMLIDAVLFVAFALGLTLSDTARMCFDGMRLDNGLTIVFGYHGNAPVLVVAFDGQRITSGYSIAQSEMRA